MNTPRKLHPDYAHLRESYRRNDAIRIGCPLHPDVLARLKAHAAKIATTKES